MSKAQEKIERMKKALSHQEGDRVPAGEFFWSGFVQRCQIRWGNRFDPYREFDLDYIVINPTWIRRFASSMFWKRTMTKLSLKPALEPPYAVAV